ncbi:putative glutathione s-transferase parc [Quercus suber]|uniref:Glutathione s-transferase parc n=1 Tax=Quercus suber TaxID=58331 RepID=A0AAW0L7I8_QUESU
MKYRADTFDYKSALSSECFLHTIFHFISLLSFPCIFYLLQYLQFCENGRRECPKIIAWAKRCLQKETLANSLADQKKVYEDVLRRKRSLE